VTRVTRLCIDRLRALRAELASDLSIAFLVLLERLAPEERAAFLLDDVFDCEYAEVARQSSSQHPGSSSFLVSRSGVGESRGMISDYGS
jgi:hypothetical protein